MRNIILKDSKGFTYKRVTKTQARRAYNNGLTVVWIPVNLRPFTHWAIEIPTNIMDIGCNYAPFDNVLDMFEGYNCNSETGRYTAFYMPFKVVDGIEQYDYDYLK